MMSYLSEEEKDINILKDIVYAINKIEAYTNDVNDIIDFEENTEKYDATLLNFIVVGESVARLSDNIKEENDEIPWKNIKGFRNYIAHDYFGVDISEVWDVIQNHISKLKKDIEQIIENKKE